MPEEIEIPVLVKTPSTPDGTIAGIGKFAGVFQRAFGAIKGHPYVVGAILLLGAAKKSVVAWREQEEAINALNQAMVQQGVYTRELSAQYQQNAMAIQRSSKFADEEVMKAEAALQSYLGEKKISLELLRTIANFATAQRMGIAQAAELIGKSVGTATNALVRYGIVLDANASPQDKLAAVTKQMEERWGGQAEASTKGLGAITQMQNALTSLLEVVGREIAPMVSALALQVSAFAKSLQESKEFVTAVASIIDGLQVGAVAVASSVRAIAAAVPTLLRSRFQTLGLLIQGNVDDALHELADGNARSRQIGAEVQADVIAFRKKIDLERAERSAAHESEILQMQNDAVLRRKEARDHANLISEAEFKVRGEKEIVEEMARLKLRKDETFIAIEKKIRHEKDLTKLRELELQKRKVKEVVIRDAAVDFYRKNNRLGALADKNQVESWRPVLAQLADLRGSKFGPQVLIGKGAAVAQIIINTQLAIAGATEALMEIPPPVGEALATAMASFLALYGAEQVRNIVDSSIDDPGRIGGIDLTLPSLLEAVWGYTGQQYAAIGEMVSRVYGFTGNLIEGTAELIAKTLEKLGPLGDVLAFAARGIGDIYGTIYGVAAEVVKAFYGTIAGVIADVVRTVANAVAAVVEGIVNTIGGALDSVFGWLFAEGGIVQHVNSVPVVTPLPRRGVRLGIEVNVTIKGGLVPSRQEADRLAALIYQEMRG